MPDEAASFSFPDVPKLELDQLIDQLVERAEGVQRAHGRLRELVRAIGLVSGELTLETVLRNVVEASRDLVGARHAALALVQPDGRLEQSMQSGAKVEDATHLDVPIRVGGAAFGTLRLAGSMRGGFTQEDEELVAALAAAAAAAIGNARLYDESRLQQHWLRASMDIEAQLLAARGEDPLQMVARAALEIAGADVVTLSLLTPERDRIVIEHAVGTGAEHLLGSTFPVEGTLAGTVVRTGRPALHARYQGSPPVSMPIGLGPVMVVPLTGGRAVRGVLSLMRRRGRPAFTAAEAGMAAGFAAHASVALELADSRTAEQKVILLEDRDRIARDLHDHVIQELFAVGMSLEGVADQVEPELSERVRQRVTDLDHTIRRIRTSIFALSGPQERKVDSLRRRVLEIAEDVTPLLGFAPHVTFGGIVDLAVPSDVGEDVEAVVRELLTNVAKHARARRVDVDLGVAGDRVTVLVVDNGRGAGDADRNSGLANLRARAQRRGGSFEIGPAPGGGTRVRWTASTRAAVGGSDTPDA